MRKRRVRDRTGRFGKRLRRKSTSHTRKLVTWSKTRSSKKRKAVKTRYMYDINHDSEGIMTRYQARMVAQGVN